MKYLVQMSMTAGRGAMSWTAQWCRLLQASATFGPLVLMALEMVKDVVQFIVLLSGIATCGILVEILPNRCNVVGRWPCQIHFMCCKPLQICYLLGKVTTC